MTRTHLNFPNTNRYLKRLIGISTIGCFFIAMPVAADEAAAKVAISRADARVEMVTRQAGVAGSVGDQSFNQARQRLVNARVALKSGQYDHAERLATQAALLASLSSERATLAALQISNASLLGTANSAPAQ